MPAPVVGQPLPRAAEAYSSTEKWSEWILAERGHGRQWAKVFRVGPADSGAIWAAVAHAVIDAPVSAVRDVAMGITCEVSFDLGVGHRHATVLSAWHYAHSEGAPRLVTAYPTT